MKIDRIQIEAFGRLQGFDTGPTSLADLVVVLGPNEAGKSTLFTFLTTALYGFQPATRERNPHVPWGADEAAGRVRLRLDGGGCGEVERRLRSQPSGRLTLDGVETDIRNQPLPWVEHVPRTVFGQVFALTLAELATLDSETWARIQDKVVGTMGAADLRAARAVAEELEQQAGEIWRPNRRGNQRLRDVQAEARELRARRVEAAERDARIRALVEERERVRARLHEARQHRQRDRIALERAQSLLPVKRQTERIAALRLEGGDRGALGGLPSDPVGRLAELEAARDRLRERLDVVTAALRERESEIAALDDRSRRLVARRDEVGALAARATGSAAERARAAELEAELRAIEAELDAVGAELLSRPWRDVPAGEIEALPMELLRDRAARARLHPVPARVERRNGGRWVPVALIAGMAILVSGVVVGSVVLGAAGAALGAIALTLLVAARREASASAQPDGRETARRELLELVTRLPIRRERLERPGEALVSALARLQLLVRERGHKAAALAALRESVSEADHAALALARSLGVDDPGSADASAEAIVQRLDVSVREAERVRVVAEGAEREAGRLRDECAVVRRDLTSVEEEIGALRAAGEALVTGDPVAGLRSARNSLRAHRRADELREELQRAHPDLAEIEAQIDGADSATAGSWVLDDEALAVTRARLEGLEEEIEQLVKRAEALERDAEHLRERETVDAVDGEIASLREREASLARERDRKWVLAKLLRQADRRFREEHQPDLLRRASSYLRHLTGGRYERLLVDEREGADLFQVVGPGLPAPIPLAPPVSTGTLEQAYLSLRLAIVDHLDQGGERLPLFVDEVFVNWDRRRRARGLEVIAGVSRARQLFVFTCHEGVARELEERGASLLPLTADRG